MDWRDERGETLVELLITIMVIGVGLVAVVGMMGSSIIASDAHRGMAEGEVVVRDFGEAVKARARSNRDDPATTVSNEYIHCPDWKSTAFFDPATFAAPTGWTTPVINTVEWWIPGTPFPTGSWSTNRNDCTTRFDSCAYASGIPDCDPGLQRVTFTVSNTRTDYASQTITGRVLVRRSNEGTP